MVLLIGTDLPAPRFKRLCDFKTLLYVVAGICFARTASLDPMFFTAVYCAISAPVFRFTAAACDLFICHKMIPISDFHP